MKVVSILLLLTLLNVSIAEDWKPVRLDVKLTWDLENAPLQIKTDSTEGSEEWISVNMYNSSDSYIGRVYVRFTTPMQYCISHCNSGWTEFPVTPPAEVEKIWTFSKTKKNLIISSNGVQLVKFAFSRSSYPKCVPYWDGDVVEKIAFYSGYDDASDYYRELITDWKPVDRDYVKLTWDLENTPLQIKTDSTEGSKERIYVYMYDSFDNYIGYVEVRFTTPMQYYIRYCSSILTDFPVTPPAEVDKIWTFSKTEESLSISCNGVQLVEYTFSESSDSRSCVSQWGGDVVEKIEFYNYFDTASEYYREVTEPIDPDYQLDCLQETMQLAIEKDEDIWGYTLMDPSCHFGGNVTNVTVPLDKCGTISQQNATHIIYKNQVHVQVANNSTSVITRSESYTIDLLCAYERTGTTGGVSWSTQVETERIEEGNGNFNFSLDIYTDENYSDKVGPDNYPLRVSINETLHFEVSVSTPGLLLSLVNVLASNSLSGENATHSYYLMQSGCIKDSTLRVMNPTGNSRRFSFQAFQFLGAGPSEHVYIQATVRVCTENASCISENCGVTRRKRAAETEDMYQVVQGPFQVVQEPARLIQSETA